MSAGLRVGVLGAGNWGTTLSHVVASNGHEVVLWTRDPAVRDEINGRRTNRRSVPGLAIATGVVATTDMAEALEGRELVIFAVPSQAFRAVCREAGDRLAPEQFVLHATKGLEGGSHRRMSEILREETCVKQLGALAGPSIAAEIAAGKPAGVVIASSFPRVVQVGRRALVSDCMMVFRGDDVVGVEIASALKNVVAIAAGIATEMQVGDNARAFLIARGLAEMASLGQVLGARPATFAGLAGIGDLVVTCSSPHSRNNRVGRAIARGQGLTAALAELGMVAEGVFAATSAHDLAASHGIDAPLLDRVYRVLYEGLPPERGLQELMRLQAGADVGWIGERRSTA